MGLKLVLPGSIHIFSPKAQLACKTLSWTHQLLVGHYDYANISLKSATARAGCDVSPISQEPITCTNPEVRLTDQHLQVEDRWPSQTQYSSNP